MSRENVNQDRRKIFKFGVAAIVAAVVAVAGGWGYDVSYATENKRIFKVANMNAGPAGTQWGRAVLEGEKASEATIENEFPDVDVQWFNSWNVKPADVKSIVESYIADGVQLIETGDFTQPIFKKIIEAHPEIYFIEPAFTLADTPNAGAYTWDLHIGFFLAGIVAGGATKTNKIGFVTAFESPYDARTYHWLREGALRVNPDVKVFYNFTGTYKVISSGYKAASALIAVGSDFIFGAGNGMTNGCIKAAADSGVYSIGVFFDQYDLAPDSVVTTVLWDFGVALSDAIRDVLKDTFNHPFYEYKLKDGTVSLSPYRQHEAMVADSVRKELEKVVELSKAGELELYPVEKFPPELAIK
jgi:basic membrane protein A